MSAEDGAVLREGIEVIDEFLHSDFALTKVVLMYFLLVWSIVHPSHNTACHLVGLQVYPD